MLRDAIIERLAQVGLELNLDKTRIVYCKDSNRTGSHEHEQFTFLGYTFRPRLARSTAGENFVSFLPAVSDDAAKRMRRTVKRWRLHLWSGLTLADLAQAINSKVRGWINYYGRFYRTELIQTLKLINHVPDALGHAEIQAVARPSHANGPVPGGDRQTGPRPVRALGVGSAAHGWMTRAR